MFLCCVCVCVCVCWLCLFFSVVFFFFKQKTAYEMRISDWSSDVCSSDLRRDRSVISGRYAQRYRLRVELSGAMDQLCVMADRRRSDFQRAGAAVGIY